jgi:hypothetical protein
MTDKSPLIRGAVLGDGNKGLTLPFRIASKLIL